MLLKVIVYAYLNNVYSGRQMEKLEANVRSVLEAAESALAMENAEERMRSNAVSSCL